MHEPDLKARAALARGTEPKVQPPPVPGFIRVVRGHPQRQEPEVWTLTDPVRFKASFPRAIAAGNACRRTESPQLRICTHKTRQTQARQTHPHPRTTYQRTAKHTKRGENRTAPNERKHQEQSNQTYQPKGTLRKHHHTIHTQTHKRNLIIIHSNKTTKPHPKTHTIP